MQYNLNPLMHQENLKIQNVFECGDIKLPHTDEQKLLASCHMQPLAYSFLHVHLNLCSSYRTI